MRHSNAEIDAGISALLAREGREVAVWGYPAVWSDDDFGREPLFHLLVRPATAKPEIWELEIHAPDEEAGLRPPGCRLRRLEPPQARDEWLEGCLDLATGSAAWLCDHTVDPHQPRVVTLGEDSEGLSDLVEAVLDTGEFEEPAAYEGRLVALAAELVQAVRLGAAPPDPVDLGLSFAPEGADWQPPVDWLATAGDLKTAASCAPLLIPVTTDPDGQPQEWAYHEVYLDLDRGDHGTYVAIGDGERPGGSWVFEGWFTLAGGALLAVSGCDDFQGEPPQWNRIVPTGLQDLEYKSPDWWLVLMRAVTLAGSQWAGGDYV